MERKHNWLQVFLRSLSYLLVAVLASVIVLREQITWLQAVGGLLILGFTLYNEISPTKK